MNGQVWCKVLERGVSCNSGGGGGGGGDGCAAFARERLCSGSHLLRLCSVQGPLARRELGGDGQTPRLLNTRKHFTLTLQTTWL